MTRIKASEIAATFRVGRALVVNGLKSCAYGTVILAVVTSSVVGATLYNTSDDVMSNPVVKKCIGVGSSMTSYHLNRAKNGEFRPSLVEQKVNFVYKVCDEDCVDGCADGCVDGCVDDSDKDWIEIESKVVE